MIKFNCPSCSQVIEGPDETLLEETVDCPTCGQRFKPRKILKPHPIPPASPTINPRTIQPKPTADMEALKIEGMANGFVAVSVVFAVMAVLGFFVGISGDEQGWIIMGTCSGAAFFSI
jgi:hypothetical protein